jgi:hypothetical protein
MMKLLTGGLCSSTLRNSRESGRQIAFKSLIKVHEGTCTKSTSRAPASVRIVGSIVRIVATTTGRLQGQVRPSGGARVGCKVGVKNGIPRAHRWQIPSNPPRRRGIPDEMAAPQGAGLPQSNFGGVGGWLAFSRRLTSPLKTADPLLTSLPPAW